MADGRMRRDPAVGPEASVNAHGRDLAVNENRHVSVASPVPAQDALMVGQLPG